eukprot:TRINITY_DN6561_c0_g2_i4.p2 TRINITY_DN6561_c0_g2~~TRINITY_DN6561_c0_g2_i4.p2  ORF type:complete len:110 (-),score=11.14 TRINITY_DN6561_c0_g2_i4:366-695(-)
MYCDDAGKNQVLLAVLQPKQRAALASDVGWWHLVPLGEELSGSELNLCTSVGTPTLHNPQTCIQIHRSNNHFKKICRLSALWPLCGLQTVVSVVSAVAVPQYIDCVLWV